MLSHRKSHVFFTRERYNSAIKYKMIIKNIFIFVFYFHGILIQEMLLKRLNIAVYFMQITSGRVWRSVNFSKCRRLYFINHPVCRFEVTNYQHELLIDYYINPKYIFRWKGLTFTLERRTRGNSTYVSIYFIYY